MKSTEVEIAGSSKGERIIRPNIIYKRVPFSRATLWRWERAGRFPKRRKIGLGRSVGWFESEIDLWIADQGGVT